jgi:hypothetical protein
VSTSNSTHYMKVKLFCNVWVCVCERERESVCVCVRERERERERERDCFASNCNSLWPVFCMPVGFVWLAIMSFYSQTYFNAFPVQREAVNLVEGLYGKCLLSMPRNFSVYCTWH